MRNGRTNQAGRQHHSGRTEVLVLGIGRGVPTDTPLLTLGRVLRPLAGRAGPVHVVLAGRDAVGSAACQIWVWFRFDLPSCA